MQPISTVSCQTKLAISSNLILGERCEKSKEIIQIKQHTVCDARGMKKFKSIKRDSSKIHIVAFASPKLSSYALGNVATDTNPPIYIIDDEIFYESGSIFPAIISI